VYPGVINSQGILGVPWGYESQGIEDNEACTHLEVEVIGISYWSVEVQKPELQVEAQEEVVGADTGTPGKSVGSGTAGVETETVDAGAEIVGTGVLAPLHIQKDCLAKAPLQLESCHLWIAQTQP
jgi:hypothetical protein